MPELSAAPPMCQHCGERPQWFVKVPLCAPCGRKLSIRDLYTKRPHHTEVFLAWLALLAERASRQEPLFQRGDPPRESRMGRVKSGEE